MSMDNKTLAQRLSAVMQERKITISDLSHDLRVPEQSLRTWIIGRQPRKDSPVWLAIDRLEKQIFGKV